MTKNTIKFIYGFFNGMMIIPSNETIGDTEKMIDGIPDEKYFVFSENDFKLLDDGKMNVFLHTEEALNIINCVSNIKKEYDTYCVVIEIYSLRMANVNFDSIYKYISKKYKNVMGVLDIKPSSQN